MNNPCVVAVMLVDGRREMVARAVQSFRAQTYRDAHMLVFDSGEDQFSWRQPHTCSSDEREGGGCPVCLDEDLTDWRASEIHVDAREFRGSTIGALRNAANALANRADIIVHWDSDDWSHPRRLEEQVGLLQASGKACVGYREALFWDTRGLTAEEFHSGFDGAAWLYRNGDVRFVLGASMCYWRSAWESCPFDDAPHEDRRWWLRNAALCRAQSAVMYASVRGVPMSIARMVCGIHGGNTEAYDRATMRSAPEWRRTPGWDKYCQEVMR